MGESSGLYQEDQSDSSEVASIQQKSDASEMDVEDIFAKTPDPFEEEGVASPSDGDSDKA